MKEAIMRIIYLHQYFNTPNMYGGTRSFEMARRLVAAGHEVHMITTWRKPTEKKTGSIRLRQAFKYTGFQYPTLIT